MKRFEYVTTIDITPPALQQYGLAGWELVCVVQRKSGSGRFTQFYFKRELAEPEAQPS